MKKTGNYIKITLHRIKICSDINLSTYNLKITFGKQSCETEKICMKEVDYGGKSYFFDLTPGTRQSNIEISAISKTLFIFDSQIAKVTIPFNLNKFDDKREWYYLKNVKEENVIGVLISIYCELKPDFSINIENIPNANTNNSYLIQKSSFNNADKRESSYDVHENKSNVMSIINKSHNNSFNNIQRIVVNNSFDDIKKKDIKSKSEEDDQTHLDNTIVCADNYKSPDLSTFSNNMFSPASYRNNGDKSHFNYNLLNLSNLNQKLNTSNKMFNKTTITTDIFNNEMPLNNFLNNVDSFSEVKNLEENNNDYQELMNKLKLKAAQIQDEQDRLRRFNDEILKNREKIKQKEAVIIREKEKLESYIKNFKVNRAEFDKKTNTLNETFNKLNNELNKFSLEKQIFQFDKALFMNLNLYSNIGKIFSGVSLNEHSQVNELRKKSSNSTCTSKSKVSFIKSHANFPYDNTNSTLATIKHNAKSSFNSEKRKKEIIIERPSSNIRKGEEKESYLRKESQNSSRGSVDKEQGKILRSFTNSSLLNNITINTNLNHSDSHSISNMNEINGNINLRDKESKYYPPVAQIDLNYKKKNGFNNVTAFDLLSPIIERPINQESNRLIDSLDNFSLMYNIKPSNSNAHDKKENNHNNNKLILASDDQKSLSKNNEENKRKIATNRLGNSGAVQNVASGMSSSNVNNMMLNTNLNMGVTSNSTVIQKDKKNSLGPITKTEKNPLKISNNNLSNYTNIYNSNNKVESFGLTKINLNPSSKVNSTKRAKG